MRGTCSVGGRKVRGSSRREVLMYLAREVDHVQAYGCSKKKVPPEGYGGMGI